MKLKSHVTPAFALLAGFLTIFILNTVSGFLVHQKIKGMLQLETPIDTRLYSPVLHIALSIITPIVGGMVVGYICKKNGAYYGGVLAIIIKIISLAITVSIFFYLPTLYGIQMDREGANIYALQNIKRHLISAPILILFVAWGGWVGEKLAHIRTRSFT